MTEKDITGIRVLVYGSLKMGHGNHGLLDTSEFLGYEILRGNWKLVDLTYYPGLVRTSPGNQTSVLCEVYRVMPDVLETLDCLEGHPSYYCREKIPTLNYKNAWVYLLPSQYAKEPAVDQVHGVSVWRPNDEEIQYVEASRQAA